MLRRVAGDGNDGIDQGIVENGIKQAQAEIDAYCGALYRVPMGSPPLIIKKCAVDMALFHIFSGHGFAFGDDSKDKIIKVRYDQAIDFLKQVAAAKVELDAPKKTGGDSGDQDGTANLSIKSEPEIFGRSKMGSF